MTQQNRGCLPPWLAKLISMFAADPPGPKFPKMNVNTKFITPAETNFYRVLAQVLGDRGVILMQVSMGQLIFLPGGEKSNPGRQAWFNKLSRRSLDFLICDPQTLRPLIAIELDEPSHDTPKRRQRDQEVNLAFKEVDLPLLRLRTKRSYNTQEIAGHLAPFFSNSL